MADGNAEARAVLFADLEGSTQAVDAQPSAASRLEAALDGAARTVEDSGGIVFDRGGDSVAATFAHSGDAVKAALGMQRSLAAATPLDTGPLRLRIGIHYGEAPAAVSGATVRPVLNEAARVMGAAHGGQILLSGQAKEALGRVELQDVELKRLGAYRLPGIRAAVELFQVTVPDLPQEFPSPSSVYEVPDHDPYGLHAEGLSRQLRAELAELDHIVGAEPAKDFVRKMVTCAMERSRRISAGDPGPAVPVGAIFVGPRGSGKTLVANSLHKVLRAAGHFPSATMHTADSALLGYFPDSIASSLEESRGGPLVLRNLDASVGELNPPAVTRLLIHLEHERRGMDGRFVSHDPSFVILFARHRRTVERLFEAQPELEPYLDVIEFPALADHELAEVFVRKARSAGYTCSTDVHGALRELIAALPANERHARRIGEVFDDAAQHQTLRVASQMRDRMKDRQVLRTITAADLPSIERATEAASVWEELDALVGLDSVKQQIRAIAATARFDEARKRVSADDAVPIDLRPVQRSWNFAFVGNPGTGKTTAARLLGRIFHETGLLPRADVVEVSRSDLVAQYVGQTAPLVRAAFERALGGVLFIDEAHALGLYPGVGEDYGPEAIDTLLKLMEDHRGEIVVVLAGYTSPMQQLLRSNEGLQSRMTDVVHFDDLSVDELGDVLVSMADAERLKLTPAALATAKDELARRRADPASGNARAARKLLQLAISRQSLRLQDDGGEPSDEQLRTLEPEDFGGAPEPSGSTVAPAEATVSDALTELDALIGLDEVKEEIRGLGAFARVQRLKREHGQHTDRTTMHMVFAGAPGTGKTTVAMLVAKILHAHGAIRTDNLVAVTRPDLVSEHLGGTAEKTRRTVLEALGGVLVIDEAYALMPHGPEDYGHEALAELVALMEEHRDDLVVILAGYTTPMDRLLDANPGLRSRIGMIVDFPNYRPGELLEILTSMATDAGYELGDGVAGIVRPIFERAVRSPQFGNARSVRQLLEHAIRRHALRLEAIEAPTARDLAVLNADDFGGEIDTGEALVGYI